VNCQSWLTVCALSDSEWCYLTESAFAVFSHISYCTCLYQSMYMQNSLNLLLCVTDISSHISVLLYNAETWTTTADIQRRLRTFEMSCLRRILGVTRLACMRNTDVMDRLNVKQDIVQRLQTRRLRFFGHVVRMPPERLPYIALHGRADGQRPRGRPRKRWLDGVQEDCRDRGMSLIEAFRFAEDRTTWRSILGLSERVHTSP